MNKTENKTNGDKITITITKEHNEKLNNVVKHSRINAITKSAIVDLALARFFEDATTDSIESEITTQIRGDA